MLNCKNCNHPYSKDQIFCDQCGNPLPPEEKREDTPVKRWMACPTCKRKIIETTTICPFCGEDINLELVVEVAVMKSKRKNFAILGIILGTLSFISLVVFPLGAFTTAVVGLLLSIMGLKGKKVLGICGIIANGLALILTIILVLLVENYNYKNSFFSWSLKNNSPQIEESSNSARFKNDSYAAWLGEYEQLLVITKEGTYEWYTHKNQLQNGSSKGVFTLESGISISNDMLYEDEYYYYYELILIELNSTIGSPLSSVQGPGKQKIYHLGLNKHTRVDMCIEDIETGKKDCFKKMNIDKPSG